VLYHEGAEFKHAAKALGKTVTESDSRIHSLSPGLDALADFLTSQNDQGPNRALLIFHSTTTLKRVLDSSPHDQQREAIGHLTQLGEILLAFPNLNIKLLWLHRNCPFVGFKRAKQLALEAIRVADITAIDEPQSIVSAKRRVDAL
jgi:hypothetical protein